MFNKQARSIPQLVFLLTLFPMFSLAQNSQEFIVELDKDVNMISFQEEFSSCELIEKLSRSSDIYLISCEVDEGLEKEMLGAIQGSQLITQAQFNHHNVVMRETEPDDGNYVAQWHLPKISAPLAWDISTGNGMDPEGNEFVIAVVDDGFDLTHNDLNFQTNVADSAGNGIDDDGNGYVDDSLGWNVFTNTGNIDARDHGTGTSGVIAAIGNNQLGVAGLNWNQKVLPVQGLTSNESIVIKAYDYIYEQRRLWNESNGDTGMYIVAVNSSFGVDNAKAADYPLWCERYDKLGSVGILSVAATTNSNTDVDFWGDIPTTCPSDFLISVTSTNRDDALSTSPNAGYGLNSIDLGAPGEDIYTTRNGGFFGFKSGTSFASPVVTGAIGLMYSSMCDSIFFALKDQPDSLALLIRDYLLSDGFDAQDTLADKVATGGRLNVFKAVEAVNQCRILGQEEQKASGLSYFPNPSNGELRIRIEKEATLHLYDVLGKEIRNEQLNAGENLLNWTDLSPGMYLLRRDGAQETHKWMIEP